METTEKIIALLNDGWDISLHNCAKRMDGKRGRDWYVRFCWVESKGERNTLESEWKGFSTAKQAINDMLNKVKPGKNHPTEE